MTDYVYLDNYRGFQKALIPIRPMSFLVGENSSGKTSFLSAFRSLSGSFWAAYEGNPFSQGRFSDNVSANSKNKSYFTVGIIKTSNEETSFSKVVFKDKEGASVVNEAEFGYGHESVRCKRIGGIASKISYKFRCQDEKDLVFEIKKSWDEQGNSRIGFKTIKNPREIDNIGYIGLDEGRSLVRRKLKTGSQVPAPMSSLWRLRDEFPIIWTAPIRSKPKRTYDEAMVGRSPEGEHMPYLVRKTHDSDDGERFRRNIYKFGVDSGLFTGVSANKYGSSRNSPFELTVKIGKKSISILNVGYGVSQSLPVIVDILLAPTGALHVMQQPEVHLHPRAQAALGSLIFEAARQNENKFLIETHSDYLIDRFRIKLRSGKFRSKSSIIFFENKHGFNSATEIPITNKGDIVADHCPKYREFFMSESMKIISG